jgi:hypothetical protein
VVGFLLAVRSLSLRGGPVEMIRLARRPRPRRTSAGCIGPGGLAAGVWAAIKTERRLPSSGWL